MNTNKYNRPYRATQTLQNEVLEMTEHKAQMTEAQRKADDINRNCPDVKAIVRNDATIVMITGDKYKVDTFQPHKVGYYDYSNILYIGMGLALICLIAYALIFGH